MKKDDEQHVNLSPQTDVKLGKSRLAAPSVVKTVHSSPGDRFSPLPHVHDTRVVPREIGIGTGARFTRQHASFSNHDEAKGLDRASSHVYHTTSTPEGRMIVTNVQMRSEHPVRTGGCRQKRQGLTGTLRHESIDF